MDILLWKKCLDSSYKKNFGKGGVDIIIKLFNKPETKHNRQNPLLLAVLQET